MKERASADGRSKNADRLQLESSRTPHPAFVNVIVNVNEQPTSGRAFSLVELLAVVGIIALLSVAAVPVMRGLGGAQSSRATAQILVSALEQARTAAILSGTNAFLVLPGTNFPDNTNFPYRYRSYAILRSTVDLDSNGFDDSQTNVSTNTGWVLLSKWERLPGDLIFSTNLFSTNHPDRLESKRVNNLAVPNQASWAGDLSVIGFAPNGSLWTTNTNGLLFASTSKTNNGLAEVADRIEVFRFSGRIRYAGLTNRVPF